MAEHEFTTAMKAAGLRFRDEVCLPEWQAEDDESRIDASREQDWFSLSLGFFRACGLDVNQCHTVAIWARYDMQYWEG